MERSFLLCLVAIAGLLWSVTSFAVAPQRLYSRFVSKNPSDAGHRARTKNAAFSMELATPAPANPVNPVPSTTEDRVTVGGLSVSPLGVGTWAWGDSLFWGYSESMDNELQDVFDASVERGINFFDTAEVYGFGRSELLCGKFKRKFRGPDVLKSDIVLASKFAPLPFRLSRENVVDACKSSLDRMGMSSMELYQIHWPAPIRNEAYWEGIADCYEQGLIKAVGVSNYSAKLVRSAHECLAKRGVPLASNQVLYNLKDRKIESNGVLKTCQELDVKVLAYSPLAQGLLTGKYSESNLPSGPRSRLFRRSISRSVQLLDELSEVAEARGKTQAQVALNWAISKGTIPIPGAKNTRQAEENAGALGWRLTDEEMVALDLASRETQEKSGRSLPSIPFFSSKEE